MVVQLIRCRSCETALWRDARRCPVCRVRVSAEGRRFGGRALPSLALLATLAAALALLILR